MYMPNVPVVPMFTEQGQFHAGGHINLRGNINGNIAYSFSDHIAGFANASTLSTNGTRKDVDQKLWEAGIGYFDVFGKDKKRIFEVYAGFGKGNTDKTYKDITYDGPVIKDLIDVDFNKIFIQVNYTSEKKKDLKLFGSKHPLNFGTALRLSHVSMTNFKLNGVDHPLEDNVLIEPIFYTRMGLSKNFQVQYTNGMNIGLIHRNYMKAGNTVFTLGVVYNIGMK
ncbi:hypothetical protein Pedsa_1613 [Pseudopedobacter saltans DSM 12145]|uniref:Outer membrane protein beta-barrel domain-containing protein n=2 Tax=Pseudopedobacter saltans TaxID=151895 RepID=F0S6R2_PSESL|nr:hypothetical protein Pedsa_1613 [Pseudopedobacter saltans DSM 12145]